MRNQVVIATPTGPYRKFYRNGPVAPAAYAAITPTTANPFTNNADGFVILDNNGVGVASFAKLMFWANATAGSTFKLKIVGYQLLGSEEVLPITLADLTCTVGSVPRASNSGEKYVSGIAINSGLVVANYEIIAADSNVPIQYLKLDPMGVQAVNIVPGPQVTGTVTSMNGALCDF